MRDERDDDPELQSCLEMNDADFIKQIPKIMIISSGFLFKNGIASTRKQVFLLFIRSLQLLANRGDVADFIPLAVVCQIQRTFLKTNENTLLEHLRPLEGGFHTQIDMMITRILDSIRQMEKGGGKKTSASLNMDRVMELVQILSCLAQVWPKSVSGAFWKVSSATSSLLFLYEGSSKIASSTDDSIVRSQVKECKLLILDTISQVLDTKFWKVLADESIPDQEKEVLLNDLCDWALFLLDSNTTEGKVECFIDAHLLLDYEIFKGMSDSIEKMVDIFKFTGKDFDMSRVDYLLMSLEHIVAFSGNTQLHIDERKKVTGPPPSYTDANANSPIQSNDAHMAIMLNISHVHDLFPDFGDGFIEACLKEYENDPELVVMALLEDQLPPHLANLDRSMPSKRIATMNRNIMVGGGQVVPFASDNESIDTVVTDETAPLVDTAVTSLQNLRIEEGGDKGAVEEESVLANRRNVFDGDKYDVLSGKVVDKELVHVGKKDKTADFEKDRLVFIKQQKEAIIAAQYQVEDDEYDDTYDATDIKLSGLYESESLDPSSKSTSDRHDQYEKQLVAIYKSDPTLFHPSSRKSKQRNDLCQSLGWTNEQLEGWFIMFNRNPKRDQILEKYDKPENRIVQSEGRRESAQEGGRTSSTSANGNESPSSAYAGANRGRGSSRGGGRGRGAPKKRGQRIYKPPNE